MTAFALTWFEDEDPDDLTRWALAAAVVVGIHVALIFGYLLWHHFRTRSATTRLSPSNSSQSTVSQTPISPMLRRRRRK